MIRMTSFAAVLFYGSMMSLSCAAPVSKQLYNKSIVIHWVESIVQKAPDGSARTPQVNSQYTIFVSSAGRLFVKSSRNVSNRGFQAGKNAERGPDSGSSGSGGFSFDGNRILGTAVFDGGAARLSVSFDPNFTSCTASVVYGKMGNANMKRKGYDGVIYELVSVNIGNVGCSLREGNAFAS